MLGRGWIGIERLSVGDALATRAGPALVVQSITNHTRAEGYLVYNLTVEGDHTYFVGKANGGVWAHNTGPCPTEDTQVFDVTGRDHPWGAQVQEADKVAEQDSFLGSGARSNIHPRKGIPVKNQTFTKTGPNEWRSIREGNHELNPLNRHYHEEYWQYNPKEDIMYYVNVGRRLR